MADPVPRPALTSRSRGGVWARGGLPVDGGRPLPISLPRLERRTPDKVSPAPRARQWRADLRVALMPWLVSRLLVGTGALVALIASERLVSDRPVPLDQALLAWDGAGYRDIAAHGYHSLPSSGLRFFPLFPIVGRIAAFGSARFAGAGLVIVANIAALVAMALICRLARRELGERTAATSAWLLALYPASFVLVLGYSESLLLVLSLSCFLALRQQRWWWAALAGLLAATCRPLGVVLVLPALIECARDWRNVGRAELAGRLAAVVGPAVGLGAFLVYARSVAGEWFTPLRAQETFRGELVEPVSRLLQAVGDLFSSEKLGDGLHAPFAIGLVILTVLALRKLPLSYGVYSAALVLLSVSAENLNSLERYGLNAFPLLMIASLLAHRLRVTQAMLTASAGLLVALTTLAYLGAYVP